MSKILTFDFTVLIFVFNKKGLNTNTLFIEALMTFSKEKFDLVFALHEKTMESAGEVTGDTESADFRFWSDEQIHAHLIRAESIIVATVSNIMRSGNDFFAIAKVVFRTKFGFLSKIRKFPKNLNFHQKSKIFTKNQKFSPEIKNFHQKFKFSSIIEIFTKNQKFSPKIQIFLNN